MSNDTVLAVVTAENCPKAWALYQELNRMAREGNQLQQELNMGSDPEDFGRRNIEGFEQMDTMERMLSIASALADHHRKHKHTMLRLHRLKEMCAGDKARMWIDIETTFGLDPAENQHIVDCGDSLEIYPGAE